MIGKLIVLEGIEACGKGSTATHVRNKWSRDKMITTREIGGTPYAELVREQMLSKTMFPDLLPISELLMCYAARADHTSKIIKPYMENGIHVFSERYYDSTRAYQTALFPDGDDTVERVHEASLPFIIKPDITIYLDITVDLSMERMLKYRGRDVMDKIESRGIEYLEKVRQNYLNNADESYRFVDASLPLADVLAQVDSILSELE